MQKAIRDDKVCFVCESLEEARSLITALTNLVPFYVDFNGDTYEIKDIRQNVSITIILQANVRQLGQQSE